ncbi:MAG: alpha/beta hydrolase [Clostridia bacterium]|nr:alpha/beta hydrolase [Clostridia bacterium]
MIYEKVSLPFGGKENANLTLYCPDVYKTSVVRKLPTILVIPGGGYANCSVREGEPIALHFLSRGFAAAVLRYSVKEDARFPQPLCEAALAMAYLRENAEEYHIDPNRIFTCGFSAGGHLALSLGVFWHQPWLSEAVGKDNELLRPNGQILSYPVVTSDPTFRHKGTILRAMAERDDEETLQLVSLEKQVSEHTPPTFLWTTVMDTIVPYKNSLVLAMALEEHQIPNEFHLYGWAGHGLALGSRITQKDSNQNKPIERNQNNPHIATWLSLCSEWLEVTFGVEKAPIPEDDQ